MKEYAFMVEPHNPFSFSITHVFQVNYITAVQEFKNSEYYNPRKTYSVFDVQSDKEGNDQTFNKITEI